MSKAKFDVDQVNRIREHRERLGWSQDQLAALTKTTSQQISRLENSERRLADGWLERLAVAMGIQKRDLLVEVPAQATEEADRTMTERETEDTMCIRRVANGWVIQPGGLLNEFTHVAATPAELAQHVTRWAEAQIASPSSMVFNAERASFRSSQAQPDRRSP